MQMFAFSFRCSANERFDIVFPPIALYLLYQDHESILSFVTGLKIIKAHHLLVWCPQVSHKTWHPSDENYSDQCVASLAVQRWYHYIIFLIPPQSLYNHCLVPREEQQEKNCLYFLLLLRPLQLEVVSARPRKQCQVLEGIF